MRGPEVQGKHNGFPPKALSLFMSTVPVHCLYSELVVVSADRKLVNSYSKYDRPPHPQRPGILCFHAYINPGKELSFMAGQVCVLTAGAPG